MTRKVGETISVGLETVLNPDGTARLAGASRTVVQTIVADYNNGWVRTHSGDIWRARPAVEGTQTFAFIAVE